jgi:hypothetical protein
MDRKQGQITIFIILGILIVVSVLIVIFLNAGERLERASTDDPKLAVQGCVRSAVEDSILVILRNGGMINPTQTITYKDEKYNYLCYQGDYYKNCINIHPMLEESVEREIREDTRAGVQECFNQMKEDFENKGFEVSGGATNYSIDLLPGSVEIKLDKEVEIRKGNSSEGIDSFDTSINSPLYWLVMFARDIVNDETVDCNVNYNDFVLLYPKYKISKVNYDFSEIYTIEYRNTEEKFKFAVRGCAFAPGL